MKDAVYRISLDINEHGSQAVLKAKNTDTGRKIYISLRAGGMPYTIEDDCYAAFAATKPDGSILLNNCDIVDNEIIYEFTEQTCAAIGRYRCEIKLYGPDEKLITSPRFALLVDGTVYPDGRVESTSEFSALTQLISDATKAIGDAANATDDAKDATGKAKAAANEAESKAGRAEIATTAAANAAQDARTAATETRQAAADADIAKTLAMGAATIAESKASKADAAATNVVNIVKNAMTIGEMAGESLSIDDAVELGFVGLRIFGKTTQNGTPTPDNPVELVSVGDSGSITVNVSDEQSMAIATPNCLHGIPVTSGGNYTDVNGQRWVCDEVDYARGVRIKRIYVGIFDGSSDESIVINTGSSGMASRFVLPTPNIKSGYVLCNYAAQSAWGSSEGKIGTGLEGSVTQIAYIGWSSSNAITVADFKAILAKKPLVVIAPLETPVETPLTEEEIAAYAALHTYRDNTTVSNNAGAHMDVRYVMDAKKYFADLLAGYVHQATLE